MSFKKFVTHKSFVSSKKGREKTNVKPARLQIKEILHELNFGSLVLLTILQKSSLTRLFCMHFTY